MGIEKRLQLIMASNRLNATSFADRIGVQRSNLSHILNGRNKPGYDFLLKVVQSFPNVSTHWLITGEEQINQSQDILKPQIEKSEIIEEKEEEAIPKSTQTSGKKIIKTVIFYNDFTFDVFLPNEQ